MDLLRRIGHVLGVLGVVLIFALWLFASVVNIALGCPPPPFAHECFKDRYIHDCLILHKDYCNE